MANRIIIPVKISTSKAVKLTKLLNEIKPFGEPLDWSIMYLETSGRVDGGNIQTLEEEIDKMPYGYRLSFTEFLELSENFLQIIEMLAIGAKNKNSFKRYKSDIEYFNCSEITVEMLDGHLWIVQSKNEILISHLANTFEDTRFERL